MFATEAPFPQYFDNDGEPLDGGRLYFGVANQNPETAPITVYWDAAGTQPAAQPIQTINGHAVRYGAPALIYSTGDYSLSVRNRNGVLLYHQPSSALTINQSLLRADLLNAADASKGAGMVGFSYALGYAAGTIGRWLKDLALSTGSTFIGWIQAGAGAVAGTVEDKLRESVSARDFMSLAKKLDVIAGTYLLDTTAECQAAIDAVELSGGGVVRMPGRYRISGSLTLKTNVSIDLSNGTVRQYTDNIPIFTAPAGADIQHWGLHSGTLEFNTQQTSVQTLGVGVRLANTKQSYDWFIRDIKVDKACDGIFSPNTAGTFAFVGEITNFIGYRCAAWSMNIDCDTATGANTNIVCTNCWALQAAGAEIATSKGFRFKGCSMGQWNSLFADHIQGQFTNFESCSGHWGELTAESCDWVTNAAQITINVFADSYGTVNMLKFVANNYNQSGAGEIYMLRPTSSGAAYTLNVANFASSGNTYVGANIHEVVPAGAVSIYNLYATLDRAVSLVDAGIVKMIKMWNGVVRSIGRGTTAQRPVPTADAIGQQYMDNTLDADGKPIWWNGTAWVDATGAVV